MRKLTFLLAASVLSTVASQAKPVDAVTAQLISQNFYRQNCKPELNTMTLAYTEKSSSGDAVYYVYNVNQKDGFVIVAADDAAKPILGYSDKGHFNPSNHSANFLYWMSKYKKQIEYSQQHNIAQSPEVKTEWNNLLTNQTTKRSTKSASIPPLGQSLWDQSPYYNAMCPGGSVTGCVATAMAQVMKYWSYPPHGLLSSCYVDSTTYGYSENYGKLCAEYDTSYYPWASMPYMVTSPNSEVAKLMYDCGVSVDMDYDPSGSGAYVITADDSSACAEISYVKYFGYDSSTINGLYRSNFADTTWDSLLMNELNHYRVIQYAGYGSDGGHTWMCDGYNPGDNFHMNWGWSGQDDGYYTLDNLVPGGIPLDSGEEALIGIEPPTVIARFVGSPLTGCSGTTVTYTDRSISPTNITAWQWMFPGGTPATSTQQNPSVVYNTPGTYNVTEIVTSATGVDTITLTAYVDIESPAALPLSEGFESATFPPANWTIFNPNSDATTWAPYSGAGGYGKSSNCMYYNNCVGGVTGERDQIHTCLVDYTGNSYPFIYFDVAYAPYNTTNYSDTLAVYYSTDCGTTWNNVYLKGGMTLNTTGGQYITGSGSLKANQNTQGCFVPLNANWRTDTIAIPALANQPSVMYAFENRSGDGSNMFIDNINMPKTPLGVQNIEDFSGVNIYPNPSGGQFTVALQNMHGEQNLVIYNMLGQQILSTTLNTDKTQISLNAAAGAYFYRILSLSGKTLAEGKLIIK